MAHLKSGISADHLTVDPTSKAIRTSLYPVAGSTVLNRPVYSCSEVFTPLATPTDMVFIKGSATKVIKVHYWFIGATNTAAGSQQYNLIKRGNINRAETFTVVMTTRCHTLLPPPSAIVGFYITGNPTLGDALGTLNVVKWTSPVLTQATWGTVAVISGYNIIPELPPNAKPITLRGIGESLAINFGGAALVAGQIHSFRIVWTEEDY